MWGCGNRDGLLCNLSPIDQVQLTTHPHKSIQRIWIALDMQMMCWVKPVGERWRSEKKQEIHPFLLHLLHICQDLVLKKAIERRSETLCKTTNCSKIVPLKKVLLSYLGQVQVVFCADCLMRFQCLLNVPVTHSAAMHSFSRFARKSNHTGLMMSPLYDRLMTPCYIDSERSGIY